MISELIIGTDKTLRRWDGIPFMDIRGQFHLLNMKGERPAYVYRSHPMEGMGGRPGELTVKCSLSKDLKSTALPALFFIHHVLNYLRGKKTYLTDQDVVSFNASEELEQMVAAFNSGESFAAAPWGVGAETPELPGLLDTYEYTKCDCGRYTAIQPRQSCGHGGLLALMIGTAEVGKVSIAPTGIDSASFAQALVRTGDILTLGPRSRKSMENHLAPKGFLGQLFARKRQEEDHTLRLPEDLALPDFIRPIPFHIAHRLHAMNITHKEWAQTAEAYSIEQLKVEGLNEFASRSLTGVVISLITIFNTMAPVGIVEWDSKKSSRLCIKSSDDSPILSLGEKCLTTELPGMTGGDRIHTFIEASSMLADHLVKTHVKRMRIIRNV